MKRIIQVGVGGMGAHWTNIVAQSQDWEAAAYVDVSAENLMAAATRHGMPNTRCYTELGKALSEVEADALLDVTPQQFRREVCEAAFAKGLDVLCEKPLADSLANAKALVEAADKAGRVLMVGQNYRYTPQPQSVRRWLARGRIGDIGYASVAFHKGPHFGGYREEMSFPLVLDMSIHHVDLMRFLFNADIVAVQAQSIGAPWNWFRGDAAVMAQLTLSTGVVVGYTGSWVAQGAETSWNGDWRFDGSAGTILWVNDRLRVSNGPERTRAVQTVSFPVIGQAYLLWAFREALENGVEPETSGRNNYNSLAATYALVRAAQENRRVEVDELQK